MRHYPRPKNTFCFAVHFIVPSCSSLPRLQLPYLSLSVPKTADPSNENRHSQYVVSCYITLIPPVAARSSSSRLEILRIMLLFTTRTWILVVDTSAKPLSKSCQCISSMSWYIHCIRRKLRIGQIAISGLNGAITECLVFTSSRPSSPMLHKLSSSGCKSLKNAPNDVQDKTNGDATKRQSRKQIKTRKSRK